LMNLFNPKALLFFVVVVPPFLGGRAPSVAQAMGLAAISTAIATMVHAAIVTGAAHAHERLGNRRWLGRVRRAMALVMLAMALVLALGLA
jgi:threonine/homoserine/homoserine lactone efflux protein